MFKKFEAVMNKYLMPIAHKVDKQRHLSAIKAAMVAMTPFTILGSFFAIIPALTNMLGEDNIVSKFITSNAVLFDLPVTLSIGFMSIYVVMCISYNLGNHYKLYIPGCVTLSTFAFLFIAAEPIEGGLSISNFGSKGLFCAMLVGLFAVEIYRFCKEKNLTIRMPEGVPDFVSRSFELIPTTIIVAGTFIFIRFLSLQIFDTLPPQILTKFISPLVGSMDNPWAVLGLNFCICVIFFFGIHSSVFGPITRPIMATFIAENIQAMQLGEPLPHFYTAGTSSAFFGFTGCGITIGCVIACLISKSKRYRKIGQVALFPSLFGVNEPILFGAPIILNPIMFIPFVFGGAIIGTMPMFLMHWGLLDKPFFDPPYVGVFLEAFLTNGDWRVILANGAQLILATLLYIPFFKIMEKQELREEIRKENEAKSNIFSEEDKEIIDGLDLDF
ncbi:PTS transporter subunit EIIC [Clostridium baratii]|uniref:Permease IIC component n=1 Tax=Clostridium baratii str. Sullivan TaxID=1415775 RepID=A0A0A7FYY8_9CLOT|nr:PTS transporter subunit EIIC [Clostridium baratii]AIY84783.1 PTS system, lactose/cellobiose IIC component family protein [Clostridium baratii str. Sullivan]MBS6008017.1 PTS sugar transporter subunit IIC [Clostridium baratii]MDU4912289.1 PTS transporter subunit EIIC [Clostridium baratii]CUP76575.1 PTS system transporter subunit IIC [Clostridium baratii]